MNRAIFVDLDKTLTPERKKHYVSFENEKFLKKAQREGWLVVIATGRTKSDLLKVWNKIKYNNQADFVIYSAGAVIENLRTGEIFLNESIDLDLTKKYYKKLIDNKYFIKLDYENVIFSNGSWLKNKILSIILKIKIKKYNEINYNIEPNKIGCISSLSKRKVFKLRLVLQREFPKLFLVITGSRLYIEATKKGVNKGTAVKKLASIANIDLKKSIAIGDSMNDIEMLKVVETSIAMKNSMKELKKVANYQTDSINKNGVAKAIKFFLEK